MNYLKMLTTTPNFTERHGLQLFADFYTLSSFYNKDNFFDNDMSKELLPYVKDEVLTAAATAIFSEIKYYNQKYDCLLGHIKVFNRFGVSEWIEALVREHRVDRYRFVKEKNAVERLVACAKVIFSRPNAFANAYGGPKWAEICKRWLELDKYSDFSNRDMFVLIDKLIDAAHNTGRCLDKVYPSINYWLTEKTSTTDPYWVINQSCIRKYAKYRMRQEYKAAGFSEERFRKPEPQKMDVGLDDTKFVVKPFSPYINKKDGKWKYTFALPNTDVLISAKLEAIAKEIKNKIIVYHADSYYLDGLIQLDNYYYKVFSDSGSASSYGNEIVYDPNNDYLAYHIFETLTLTTQTVYVLVW